MAVLRGEVNGRTNLRGATITSLFFLRWAMAEGYGANLIKHPEVVVDMVRQAKAKSGLPVSIKIRIHDDLRWVPRSQAYPPAFIACSFAGLFPQLLSLARSQAYPPAFIACSFPGLSPSFYRLLVPRLIPPRLLIPRLIPPAFVACKRGDKPGNEAMLCHLLQENGGSGPKS